MVGAGISGISAAYYLQKHCPNHSFAILEGRSNLGGTWDLFRYPGVRSDTDMHTLGFSFKPWTKEKTIADGASILEYLEETAHEFGIHRHIRFNHQVIAASWSSKESMWTIKVEDTTTTSSSSTNGNPLVFTCKFLYMCSGYYSYKGGYKPDFPGKKMFQGTIIHPQEWPQDLDYSNKRVVIIGSGATAMTLVPSMAKTAEHVTMLQRSPTYVATWPSVDKVAKILFAVLPQSYAHFLARRKNLFINEVHYKLAMAFPLAYKSVLLSLVKKEVGKEEVHNNFTPSYLPWDQRACLIPDGDFFGAMRSGKASVVTDTIFSFTETGINLASGSSLKADIVVTATGLQMVNVGGSNMKFTIDGKHVDFSSLWSYKGVAYSGIPNMAASYFSYVSKSWSLRAELTSQWVCKILNHMESAGAQVCEPRLCEEQHFAMTKHPFITSFSPGYMKCMMPRLPKQGNCVPWMRSEDYRTERKWLLGDSCEDSAMTFITREAAATATAAGGFRREHAVHAKSRREAATLIAMLLIVFVVVSVLGIGQALPLLHA